MSASPSSRFAALGLELPPAPKPIGVYKPVLVIDRMATTSGHGPLLPDGSLIRGRVGADLDVEMGKQAARQVGLAILASLIASLGSLDRVQRVVKVFGMVCCTEDFEQIPAVLNGCSELFAAIWGPDLGVGTRSAVGMQSLPAGMAVEIEAVFEIA
jgi:enamine deaminase RidA (YjgF/YER057c/UK114 family)